MADLRGAHGQELAKARTEGASGSAELVRQLESRVAELEGLLAEATKPAESPREQPQGNKGQRR